MVNVRIGEASFINALPFSLQFADPLEGLETQVVSGEPGELNQMMLAGGLDIAPVSSAFYLRHQDQYTLMPDIAIGSKGKVGSVLFYMPNEIEGILPDSEIYIPQTSETSVALLQSFLQDVNGYQSIQKTYPSGQAMNLLDAGHNVLVFGNEALKIRAHDAYNDIYSLDMGEEWHINTRLPAIFAVWAVRNAWAEAYPECLEQLQTQWVKQKIAFQTQLPFRDKVMTVAREICPDIHKTMIRRYLTQELCYDLGSDGRQALKLFEDILAWKDHDAPFPKLWAHYLLPV